MASEATLEAAARESRANAREDAVTITSGAKEKVDRTVASAQGLVQKIAHPMDAEARKLADERTELRKAQASAKQAAIRQMAHQEAENERFGARSQVAQLISQGQGGNRYAQAPVQLPPAPPPVGADSTFANASEVPHPVEAPPVHATAAGGFEAPPVHATAAGGFEAPPVHATAAGGFEAPPVHATAAVGLDNCINSDCYCPPVPRPLPPPPQLLDSAVVSDTAHVTADSIPSMSANEALAQPNPSENKGVGK